MRRKPPPPTVADAEALILSDYVLNGRRSAPQVRSAFVAFRAYFGADTGVDQITAERIRAYAAERVGTHEPGTVGSELKILRRALRLLVECGRLSTIPLFPRMRGSPPRQGFFERPEFDAIVSQLRLGLRPLAEFYYLTGWRLREVLSLRWSSIDLAASEIRLEPGTTKTREGRTFPFAAFPVLGALIRAQRARVDAIERAVGAVVPWVFPRPSGKAIRSWRRAWDAACIRAGYPGRLIHDCRRTAVRNLIRAGVPRKMAMMLTGHRTESVFERYDIVNGADLEAAVDRYSRYLGGGREPARGDR